MTYILLTWHDIYTTHVTWHIYYSRDMTCLLLTWDKRRCITVLKLPVVSGIIDPHFFIWPSPTSSYDPCIRHLSTSKNKFQDCYYHFQGSPCSSSSHPISPPLFHGMCQHDHCDLLLHCHYRFLIEKPEWQSPNHFHLLPRVSGINFQVIFHRLRLFPLSGRDSSTIFVSAFPGNPSPCFSIRSIVFNPFSVPQLALSLAFPSGPAFRTPCTTNYTGSPSQKGLSWNSVTSYTSVYTIAHPGICLNTVYRSLRSLVDHTWDLRRPETCLCQPLPPKQLALVDSFMLVQQLGTLSLLVWRTLT